MNILIFSWRGPGHPYAGGAEQVTHEHAKSWVKEGHKVFLFTSSYKSTSGNNILDGVEIVRKGNQILGVQIAGFLWFSLGKHPKFDLVIDQFHGIPFFTPIYVKTKKLAFIHEVAKEVWRLNPWPKPFNLIPYFLGNLFEPLIFRLVYKNTPFLTGAKSTEDDLVSWGIPRNNITVIHHGVELEDKPKKLPDKNNIKTAIFLGAVTRDKGIFDALKVFGEINRKDDSWKFWIVGKAEEHVRKEVRKMIKELGIQEKVKLWGFVSNEKKFELLAKANVMINTSAKEGWGLVNIEANAVGTPVVAYDVSGCRDSIKNGITGILVNYGDYRNIAYEAIKLVNDQAAYSKVQKNAFSWSNNFSWEKAAKESLKLVESL